jgi:hypothetical protein
MEAAMPGHGASTIKLALVQYQLGRTLTLDELAGQVSIR